MIHRVMAIHFHRVNAMLTDSYFTHENSCLHPILIMKMGVILFLLLMI